MVLFAYATIGMERRMADVAGAPIAAGLSLGIALAGAPGPVQAVLLSEAIRGGVGRGFRAQAGAILGFGALLLALALGLSVAEPSEVVLRVLRLAGGALLLWLAWDAFRARGEPLEASTERRRLPPIARGVLAVVLNPGALLFLAAVASPLLATAGQEGGRAGAVLVATALLGGTALGDLAVVLLGGMGIRRASDRVRTWVRTALAAVLAGLGVWLLVQGVLP
jgi:threonine/homoserine/homoserine lactone efflux protein